MNNYLYYCVTIFFPFCVILIGPNKNLERFTLVSISVFLWSYFSFSSTGPDYLELKRICSESSLLMGKQRIMYDPGFLYLCDIFEYEHVRLIANSLFMISLIILLYNKSGMLLLLMSFSLFFILWNIGNYTRTTLAASFVMIAFALNNKRIPHLLLTLSTILHKSHIVYFFLNSKYQKIMYLTIPVILYLIFPRIIIYFNNEIPYANSFPIVIISLIFPFLVDSFVRKHKNRVLKLGMITVGLLLVGLFASAFIVRICLVLFPLQWKLNLDYRKHNQKIIAILYLFFYSLIYFVWVRYSNFSIQFFA